MRSLLWAAFLSRVGIRERKANFIFLTINLLFLVFRFYNYPLDFGTCVKLALQSEQEAKPGKWRWFNWWQGWFAEEGGEGVVGLRVWKVL